MAERHEFREQSSNSESVPRIPGGTNSSSPASFSSTKREVVKVVLSSSPATRKETVNFEGTRRQRVKLALRYCRSQWPRCIWPSSNNDNARHRDMETEPQPRGLAVNASGVSPMPWN